MKEAVPVMTVAFFILNIMVFMFSFSNPIELLNSIFVTPERLTKIITNFGFYPNLIIKKPYILVTHMFIHGDWLHILINMSIFLYVGTTLEDKIGSVNFFLLFLFLISVLNHLFSF